MLEFLLKRLTKQEVKIIYLSFIPGILGGTGRPLGFYFIIPGMLGGTGGPLGF